MTVLSPFVYWAQSESTIFLKIDLKDVKVILIISSKTKHDLLLFRIQIFLFKIVSCSLKGKGSVQRA